MFWRFNYMTSDIDTLLDKEDVTLTGILSEDDVLQECKAQNKKLIDFLVQPQHLETLVNLVLDEPATNVDERARYKYANIACELLTSDVTQMTESLAGTEPLLVRVLSYLDPPSPLNPLQASFFSKLFGLLLARKSDLMLERLRGREDFVGRVLHHLGTSAIMDLLLRLMTSMESAECRTACITWLIEQRIIERLIELVSPSHDAEVVPVISTCIHLSCR
jgi:serine/threonine-protein phosphatase 6 regulatory subunit 3